MLSDDDEGGVSSPSGPQCSCSCSVPFLRAGLLFPGAQGSLGPIKVAAEWGWWADPRNGLSTSTAARTWDRHETEAVIGPSENDLPPFLTSTPQNEQGCWTGRRALAFPKMQEQAAGLHAKNAWLPDSTARQDDGAATLQLMTLRRCDTALGVCPMCPAGAA